MTGRSLFRVLRWAGLAAVAPVLWACNARTLEKPVLKPEATFGKTFQQTINRNVDLLFLVDDSSSMRLTQQNLETNFPMFMTRLMDPPGLPNIHVAVISSDMGAGNGNIDSCTAQTNGIGGKQGIFQYTARGNCTATGLDPTATFISDNGQGVRNYTGALEDVFTCIAALGEQGCGFEHQFSAILRSLGADGRGAAPGENAGFLRPDAYLVVILITNEDDCSATPNVPLFDDTANNYITDQLGPVVNFRCNEFGHMCDDGSGTFAHPNRRAPGDNVAATVSYTSCRASDEGYLMRVKDVADALKGLKRDPSQVIVAAITGPNTPYTVTWKAPSLTDMTCGAASCPWPVIGHSCTAADTSFADPSIRIGEFVAQFGANGLLLPICSGSFGPSLDRIAMLINASLQPPCIVGQVATKPGSAELDCTVVSHTSDGAGGYTDSIVPSCATPGATMPCWQLTAPTGTQNCAGQIVDPNMLRDPSVGMTIAQNATVNCALCVPGTPDPDRGCP
jgi:hypothetical protein